MNTMKPSPGAPVPAGISELYNSTPSKVQPWMQATGGIPAQAKICGDVDTTHGVPEGNWLIMENAPKGLKPKSDI